MSCWMSARPDYRPDIDGLRAVAIAAVVVFHAFPAAARGGFTGVDVFFVISGYLISRIVWHGLDARSFTLAWFYGRRVLRLFPALVLVLVTTLAAGRWLFLPDAYETLGKDVASAAVFASNLVLWQDAGYFTENAALRPLTHLWSLAVEEQFYLVFPLLLIAAHRSWRLTGALLALLATASFAWNIASIPADPAAAFYLLPARFWELALGALLAYAQLTRSEALPARARNATAFAGLGLLVLATFGPTAASAFPGWWALAPTGAAVLLIAAGPEAIPNRRLLASAPFVLVGRISYPLYLWHFPLLVLARVQWGPSLSVPMTLAIVGVSVVLAYGTYRLVELPVRGLARSGAWRPGVLVAPLAAVGAAGVAVFLAGGQPGRLPVELQQLSTAAFDYKQAYRESRCFLQPWQGARAFRADCVDGGEGKLLLLWGDSHAAHLYPGLQPAARERHFRIAQLTASACPPLLGYRSSERPKCHGINQAALAKARALRPETVVLSAQWEQYRSPDGLRETVAALRELGVAEIVVVGPSPNWPHGLAQALFRQVKREGLDRFPLRVKHELSDAPARADRRLRPLARELGVTYIAPLDVLCNRDGCLARVEDRADQLAFWDPSHFTAVGSAWFVEAVAPELLRGF
jgi:peptidoglycan/LPS O-acetylase OafA/YrhL